MLQIYTTFQVVKFYSQDASYKMIETYLTVDGVECVTWTDEQGTHSMTKEAYDLSQVEHLTEKVPNEVPTK